MKKEEKALLKDIEGMIGKLVEMSEEEENQQQAAVEEEDDIDCDDVIFVKKMLKDDIRGLKFFALAGDGRLVKGGMNKRTFNAMCNAFLEKYA